MMFQAGRIFAQAKTIREDALVSRAVDEIAGANFFPARCLELYPLLLISIAVTLVFWRGTAP